MVTEAPSATVSALERRIALLVNVAVLLTLAWIGWRMSHPAVPPPPTQTTVTRTVEPAPPPADPVSLDGATLLGSKTAAVVLMAFSDFKCPYCRRFATDTLPALKAKFIDAGKMQFAFREFPLPMHAGAREAAEAALCAAAQGQFWAMHDALFAHPQDWTVDTLATQAAGLHLAPAPFSACLGTRAAGQVDKDAALGKALGVTGTPTFFVGRMLPGARVQMTARIVGARPEKDFEQAILTALAASR